MAFGSKARMIKDRVASTSGDGESKKTFDSPWMPMGSGVRIFRPLQAVENGELVMAERLNASGKPIREGGKKNGAVLYGPIPAEETVFMYAWWNVNVGGEDKPKRLMLDPFAGGDINTSRFKNPLWEYIQANYAKGSRERNAIKLAFAMNVWDMTPVMRNQDGYIFYPAEDDTWRLLAYMNNGKLIDPKAKDAKLPEHYKMDMEDALEAEHAVPLNQIRILEGSYGKPAKDGGRHLFAEFEKIANNVEDHNDLIRNLGEFDLRLSVTGEGIDTQRSIRSINKFQPLPEVANFGPRYDLETWTRPWPDEAIQRLIDGEDYNDIVTEYNLAQFPTLFETAYTGDTQKPDSEEDDGLFDD